MLTHLKSAGKLKGIKGIIFGIFKGCDNLDNETKGKFRKKGFFN